MGIPRKDHKHCHVSIQGKTSFNIFPLRGKRPALWDQVPFWILIVSIFYLFEQNILLIGALIPHSIFYKFYGDFIEKHIPGQLPPFTFVLQQKHWLFCCNITFKKPVVTKKNKICWTILNDSIKRRFIVFDSMNYMLVSFRTNVKICRH